MRGRAAAGFSDADHTTSIALAVHSASPAVTATQRAIVITNPRVTPPRRSLATVIHKDPIASSASMSSKVYGNAATFTTPVYDAPELGSEGARKVS